MNRKKIVVIGSGLSAFGALTAIEDKKLDVTVVDIGELLPGEISDWVEGSKKLQTAEKRRLYLENFPHKVSRSNLLKGVPRKHLFGSHYFYKDEKINSKQTLPFSEALGGYSVAWGGATLMAREEDLRDFPFDYNQILIAAKELAKKVPLQNFEDSLTQFFPNLNTSDESSTIKLSQSQIILKDKLSQLISTSEDNLCLVGQARLATYSAGPKSCVYCGMCSSGCSYDSIFSSKQAIIEMRDKKSVEYLPNRKVIKLVELNGKVKIIAENFENACTEEIECDYVFVAAGAVNSTKIAMRTFGLNDQEIKLLKTGSFIRGYFSLQKLGFDWPQQNTQANIFMEIRSPKISDYWIHNQISTPNEIIINSIGYLNRGFLAKLSQPMKKWFLSHIVSVMTNLHSSMGPFYQLHLGEGDSKNVFTGELVVSAKLRKIERRIDRTLIWKLMRLGIVPLPFTKKGIRNDLGFHVGGSLGMDGKDKLSTDSLGRIQGSSLISFVDSSVLPSMPATTIGFLAAANAYRIANLVLTQD